jgi:hypothetical protein
MNRDLEASSANFFANFQKKSDGDHPHVFMNKQLSSITSSSLLSSQSQAKRKNSPDVCRFHMKLDNAGSPTVSASIVITLRGSILGRASLDSGLDKSIEGYLDVDMI